jgi:hypothetical protein
LPTVEDLTALPMWSVVALAARAVRRAEPLFYTAWPEAPTEYGSALEEVISRAEEGAAKASSLVAASPAAGRRGVRSAADAVREVAVPEGRPVVVQLAWAARFLDEAVQLAAGVARGDGEGTIAQPNSSEMDRLTGLFGSEDPGRLARLGRILGAPSASGASAGERISPAPPAGAPSASGASSPGLVMARQLIDWAISKGRLLDLFRAAHSEDPSRFELLAVAEAFVNGPAMKEVRQAACGAVSCAAAAVGQFFSFPPGSSDGVEQVSEVASFVAAVFTDLKVLLSRITSGAAGNEVPPSVLGPLWPGAAPARWPPLPAPAKERVNDSPARPRHWVLVAGTGIYNLPSAVFELSKNLGRRLAVAGYGLIVGGWPGVDHVVASTFIDALPETGRGRAPQDYLRQVVVQGHSPDYSGGKILAVLTDEETYHTSVRLADAVVLIGGQGGVVRLGAVALRAGRPVLPIAATGGDARNVFDRMLASAASGPVGGISREDLARLEGRLEAPPFPRVVDSVIDLLDRLFSTADAKVPAELAPGRFPEDPQKGQWGGKAQHNGRALQATVSSLADYPDLYSVRLEVISTGSARPLTGSVLFHLHNTFHVPRRRVPVHSGIAVLTLVAYGAFTVGAEVEETAGHTLLELDLAEIDAPAGFKEH